jgi:hypothetical protein
MQCIVHEIQICHIVPIVFNALLFENANVYSTILTMGVQSTAASFTAAVAAAAAAAAAAQYL